MYSELLGIVLAGGRSSRMGRNKASLIHPSKKQSMLTVQQMLLAEVGCENVVTSGANNNGIKDKVAQVGPLMGICTIVEKYQPKAVVALAIDMPFLKEQDLRHIIENGYHHSKATCFAGHPFPLYLPITERLTHFFKTHFENCSESQKGPSLKQLFKTIGVQELVADEPRRLFNANTPEHWSEVTLELEQIGNV